MRFEIAAPEDIYRFGVADRISRLEESLLTSDELKDLWSLLREKFYSVSEYYGRRFPIFKEYREHGNCHVLLVAEKAEQFMPVMLKAFERSPLGLGGIYCLDPEEVARNLKASALIHDCGMGRPEKHIDFQIKLGVRVLDGKDVGWYVRKAHARMSSMAALDPRVASHLRDMGLNPSEIALDVRLHSKSASKVPNLGSTAQLERAIADVAAEAKAEGLAFDCKAAEKHIPVAKTIGAILRPADAAAHDGGSALTMGNKWIHCEKNSEGIWLPKVGASDVMSEDSRKYVFGELNYEDISMREFLAAKETLAALDVLVKNYAFFPELTSECTSERVAELLGIGATDADIPAKGVVSMPHAPVAMVVHSVREGEPPAHWVNWARGFTIPVMVQ